jgi:uncharacterized protein YbjT (DUF2867 family)
MEIAVADLLDRAALLRAHEMVDHAIVQIPAHGDAFVAEAIENSLYAMQSCGVKSAVLKMANPTPAQCVADCGFSANLVVLRRMQSSNIPYSVVEPTMYLDTLLKPSLRQEIAQLHRIDLPVSGRLAVAWTTVDDAARMAVAVLNRGRSGLMVRCAGEAAYRGCELAAAFSAMLGQSVDYHSTELDSFRRDIESAIGVVAAAPVVSKFDFLSRYPQEASRMLSPTLDVGDVLSDFKATSLQDWIGRNRASFETG